MLGIDLKEMKPSWTQIKKKLRPAKKRWKKWVPGKKVMKACQEDVMEVCMDMEANPEWRLLEHQETDTGATVRVQSAAMVGPSTS
jgi:hypothetical protein